MNDFSYPDDSQAIERLREIMLDRQAKLREPPLQPLFNTNPPSGKCIARLLRLCFFASLWTEEGRQTRFSISYTTPKEGEFTCLFREKNELSARAVVKLAPALDLNQAMGDRSA